MIRNETEACRLRARADLGTGMRWSLAVLLANLTMVGPAFGAVEVLLDGCFFNISGPIESADLATFKSADCSSDDTVIIKLASPGGDVYTAMEIGRWARARNAVTMVDSIGSTDGRCYSSCALIYIGGVIRVNMGEVGLHRPYLAGPPLAATEVRAAVLQMISGVQEYVAEMGITPEFTHVMINTPPSAMRVFDGAEIIDLVPERDPMSDELRVAHDAAWYGLSTDEYRRREAESDDHCTLVDGRFAELKNCREAVRWGLSRSVYLQRVGNMWERCAQADDLTDEDRAAWRASGRDDLEHPLEIEARECRIAVMQGRRGQ